MRPIWKGTVAFGLVSIPVGLYPATRREELKFRLLRAKDLSPINYKRVAEADGREVPWTQIVKGYEYEKGKYVILKEEDFKRVDVEATQSIEIMDFVSLPEINPIFFHRPYFLEPEKGGGPAYAVLREVLAKTNKAGIAKVVIKTRQHLAALKANGDALVLELMHFSDELIEHQKLKLPEPAKARGRAVDMAVNLVEEMTEKWDPKRYKDDYTSALMSLIEKKAKSGGKMPKLAARRQQKPNNVIDLVSILRQSLDQSKAGGKKAPASAKKKPARRNAA